MRIGRDRLRPLIHLFTALFLTLPIASAATFTVNVFTDTAATASGSVPGTGAGVSGDLRWAINQANTAGGANTVLFSCPSAPCTITLAGPLPPIMSDLTIDGATLGNIIIDGANAYRVFFVDIGTVTLSNLQVQNAAANGGNGGNGHLGCGGGGAGLGAGLFVNGVTAAANVTLLNTYFLNDRAAGGAGCTTGSAGDGGGGGGLGANGGDGANDTVPPHAGTFVNGGGGGVLGAGQNGSTSSIDGVNGGLGGGGGTDSNGDPTANPGLGGAGYATNSAGADGTNAGGGNGGFGGGGGTGVLAGGSGGFGGGGGGSEDGGGNGGPGGGGGGSLVTGGGAGGVLVAPVTGGTANSGSFGGNGSSGGGAGAGPDIFVNQGTLVVSGSYSVGAVATGGGGGSGAGSGTADSTPVFNYSGNVNGSNAKGPVAGLLLTPSVPTLVATFIPDTVEVGASSVFTFTASNPNPIPLSNVAFSNTVPSGITLVSQTGGTCNTLAGTGGGTGTINPGAGTMSSTSNSLAASSSCTVVLQVQGASTGAKLDTSSTITSSETAAGSAATATLTVTAAQPPALSAAFGASPINEGASTSLTFTLSNSNSVLGLTNVAFTDTLPAGLLVSTPNGLSTTCGGTTTAVAGASSVTLAGVTLAAGASCTVVVNVTAATFGTKVNTTGAITSDQVTGSTASASLTVAAVATQFSVQAASPQTIGTAFNVTVTAQDGNGVTVTNYAGTVHFTSSDIAAVLPADATLTSGTGTFSATLNTAGSQTISAASSVPVFSNASSAIVVGKKTQTITFGVLPAHTYGDATFNPGATASSTLAVSYSITSGPCTTTGTTVTITGAGSCVIAADQAGNATYSAASTVSQTLVVNKAVLTVTANGVNITAGSALPTLTAGYTGFVNLETAAVLTGSPSLSTTATSNSSPGSYPITVAAGTLAAANYSFVFANGTVTVSSPPPSLLASPQSINLVYAQGTQPSTFTQDYSVSSNAGGTPFSVTVSPTSAGATDTGWLVAPPSGNAGSTYTVTINAAGLAPGTYVATLNFSSTTGTAAATLTLTVTPPPMLASLPSPLNLSGTFGATGTAALANQDVQLTSTNANVAFTAASNSPWLTFTSSGSNTPATIHIQANATGLPPGNYQGAVVVTVPGAVNSPYSIAVNFAVGTGLLPGQTAIDNAASFTTGDAAPGTILSLFGTSLSCTPNPVVTVGGVVAQVLFANGSQINFVVPSGVTGSMAVVQVACGNVAVDNVTIPLAVVDPAIFTQTSTGKGPGSIENQNGSVNTAANPASRNSYIAVYVTGFGGLNSPSADGLRRTTFPVTASIGGVAATVVYAGEAPDETSGLQQVNILVPAGVSPGAALPIVLTVDGVDTQAGVTVAVQ